MPKSFKETEQNRKSWPKLVEMAERFRLSDRAAAGTANGVLQDYGLISNSNKKLEIDRSKLQR